MTHQVENLSLASNVLNVKWSVLCSIAKDGIKMNCDVLIAIGQKVWTKFSDMPQGNFPYDFLEKRANIIDQLEDSRTNA